MQSSTGRRTRSRRSCSPTPRPVTRLRSSCRAGRSSPSPRSPASRRRGRSCRDVLCSGEPLTPDLVRALGSVLDARLHNLYGPTEAAIDVTHWEVPPPLAACERVPIGKPVANTTLFVVDEELRIVPEGEPGELCIAGVQLASGYVGQPELTEAAFCSLGSGVRVYRTRDRVPPRA